MVHQFLTVQAGFVAGCVDEFVEERGIVGFAAYEGLEFGHVDEVCIGVVVGFVFVVDDFRFVWHTFYDVFTQFDGVVVFGGYVAFPFGNVSALGDIEDVIVAEDWFFLSC